MANICNTFVTLEVTNESLKNRIAYDIKHPDYLEGNGSVENVFPIIEQAYGEDFSLYHKSEVNGKVYVSFQVETAWSSRIEDLLDVIFTSPDFKLKAYTAEEMGSDYLVAIGSDYFCAEHYCYIENEGLEDYKNMEELNAALGNDFEGNVIFAETSEQRGRYLCETIDDDIRISIVE